MRVALLCLLGPTVVAAQSGLQIIKDDAAVMLGPDGDVQLSRSGEGALDIEADVSVSGDLTVSGSLVLSDDDELGASISTLLATVSSLTATVTDLTDRLDAAEAAASSLDLTVSSLQSTVSANSDAVADNSDAIADNSDAIADNSDAITANTDAIAELFASTNPYSEQFVYASDFASGTDNWSFDGADIATLECNGETYLGGSLGSGDSIAQYFDGLGAHSKLMITYEFAAIDSWDGETAHCYVDGEEVWTDDFVHSDGEADVCANGWSENFLTVEVEVEHFGQGTTIDLTTTVNQEYDDESWGIGSMTISSQLAPAYTPVFFSDFQSNGADGWSFFGGAQPDTSVCGDFTILGGYDVLAADDEAHSVLKTINNMADHTELVISFEFLQIDDWNGETAKLFVDDVLVWSQAIDVTGSASLCGNSGVDTLIPVTVQVPHDEASAKLRFTTTVSQDASDQSWGVKSVSVYSHSPSESIVYQTNFDDAEDWIVSNADATITTCGDNNVLGGYGVFGEDASVELNVDHIIPHSSMTIEFDFVKVDSWDGESANVYVDGVLEWTSTFTASDGEQLCGSENTNWHEQFVPVSLTFPHYSHSVQIVVDTGLNQGATDESWGIANLKVTASMDDCNDVLYRSDFASDLLDGWYIENAGIDNVTTCGSDTLIGGYDNFGVDATATYQLDMPEPSGVVIAFTFLKVDSWDSEDAYLHANGLLIWSQTMSASEGSQTCGRDNTNWNEERISTSIDLGWVTDESIVFTWSTSIGSSATDESWGIADVDIYSYQACDAVAYQSAFDTDGDDGWIIVGSDGGTTTCGDYTVLGGYDTFDQEDLAQKLVELPLHTSLQIDFTFAKIDSWDTEYVTFTADHDTLWNEALSGGGGAICGNTGGTSSGWYEDFIEKSFTIDHFSQFAWLQWQADLSSGGTDESWGIYNLKVSTTMDNAYTPLYESKFQLQDTDGWTISNGDATFTSCGQIEVFGGYDTWGKSVEAELLVEDIPEHTEIVLSFSFLKIDSWDSEQLFAYIDGAEVFATEELGGGSGDAMCGSSNSGWDEQVYTHTVTVEHTADSITVGFDTDLTSGATDESWGLLGVTMFYSNLNQ